MRAANTKITVRLASYTILLLTPVSAFTLVENGMAKSVIVAADSTDKNFQAGVNDLVSFIEKMSGAKLGVLKPTEKVPDGQSVIRIGKALAEPVADVLKEVDSSEGGFVIVDFYACCRGPAARSMFNCRNR